MGTTSLPRRDVFICFSKARPGEAQVALALKDELERLDTFAYEYEDWSWVASGVDNTELDVDREKLRRMLATCKVVVLISPHDGEASVGVQTEIAELRECASPVILLHWSPSGWRPLDEPPELAGLNIIWGYEGRSAGQGKVAQNQAEHIAQQLAVAAWTACTLHWCASEHRSTAGRLIALLPEEPKWPLLNLRHSKPPVVSEEWPDPPEVGALAASVAANASADDLRSFVEQWRAGLDLLTEDLAEGARFSLQRPLRTLHEALESLAVSACVTHGMLSRLSNDILRRRGLMLVRLNRPEEAIPALRDALEGAPPDTLFEIHQALSLAQQENDPDAAIASMTDAIACAPTPDLARSLRYNRGALRSRQRIDSDAAIEDFSFVAEHAANAVERHSALLGRARLRSDGGDRDGAITDFTLLLGDADATPRLAVSAWMDRGALLHAAGRHVDAIDDWGKAIHAADAAPLQRFRTLEARAQVLEALGRKREAADDYERMIEFSDVAERYRVELRQLVSRLRG